MGRSSAADPESGPWEGPNFKELFQFLKNNRITLVCGLINNKDQTCIRKVALCSCCIEEYINFVPFSDALGGVAAFSPLGSAFAGHGSPFPVNACNMFTYRI